MARRNRLTTKTVAEGKDDDARHPTALPTNPPAGRRHPRRRLRHPEARQPAFRYSAASATPFCGRRPRRSFRYRPV